jgi:AcrR family transcriptional regulator
MPRELDLERRRAEIADASIRLLARHGSKGLTVKALANELGGSTTLITHIYPRKADLYEGILESFERSLDADIAAHDASADALENLRAFLDWCMPTTPAEIEEERLRLALLDHAGTDRRMRSFLDRLDGRMRNLFRRHLEPLVEPGRLDTLVLVFRAATNGGTLAVFEHPVTWSHERRSAVIDHLIATLIDRRVDP